MVHLRLSNEMKVDYGLVPVNEGEKKRIKGGILSLCHLDLSTLRFFYSTIDHKLILLKNTTLIINKIPVILISTKSYKFF